MMTQKLKKLFVAGIFPLSAFAVAAPTAATPTDAQIAQIVLTVNKGEVEAARLAKSNTSSVDVKNFANQMIDQHAKATKDTAAVALKTKTKPEDSDTSRNLKKQSGEELAHLKTLKGAEFDKAYVAGQVTAHQDVLNTLDNTLIPSAKNEELKKLLTDIRASVAMHLDHAKELQGKL